MARSAKARTEVEIPFLGDSAVPYDTGTGARFLFSKVPWGKRRLILSEVSQALHGMTSIQGAMSGELMNRAMVEADASLRAEGNNEPQIAEILDRVQAVNPDIANAVAGAVYDLMNTMPDVLTRILVILVSGQQQIVDGDGAEKSDVLDLPALPSSRFSAPDHPDLIELFEIIDDNMTDEDVYELCAPFLVILPKTFASYVNRLQMQMADLGEEKTPTKETRKKPAVA